MDRSCIFIQKIRISFQFVFLVNFFWKVISYFTCGVELSMKIPLPLCINDIMCRWRVKICPDGQAYKIRTRLRARGPGSVIYPGRGVNPRSHACEAYVLTTRRPRHDVNAGVILVLLDTNVFMNLDVCCASAGKKAKKHCKTPFNSRLSYSQT